MDRGVPQRETFHTAQANMSLEDVTHWKSKKLQLRTAGRSQSPHPARTGRRPLADRLFFSFLIRLADRPAPTVPY